MSAVTSIGYSHFFALVADRMLVVAINMTLSW